MHMHRGADLSDAGQRQKGQMCLIWLIVNKDVQNVLLRHLIDRRLEYQVFGCGSEVIFHLIYIT